MKIAYIIYPGVIISNRSNGVRSQALTWRDGLIKAGHDVVCINNWDNYDWTQFDIIHLFGFGSWLLSITPLLSKLNPNLILSPIIDPERYTNYKSLRMKLRLSEITRGKLSSYVYESRKWLSNIKLISTRTDFESEHIKKLYDVDDKQIWKVPLSYDRNIENQFVNIENKESFCLHISSIYQKRKNVLTLVEAAKKYGFELVLAGNKGSDNQFEPIKRAIGDCPNIKVLGFISQEQKLDLYRRAKVFALPSLQEGVGIVALDAAAMGCEIVITDIPGPKEYYNGMCCEVNPIDIDLIGKSISDIIDSRQGFQPKLYKYLRDTYSNESVVKQLIEMYKSIL